MLSHPMAIHHLVLWLSNIRKMSHLFTEYFSIPCLFLCTPHKRKENFTLNDPSKHSPVDLWYNKSYHGQAELPSNIYRANKPTAIHTSFFHATEEEKKRGEKWKQANKKEYCYRVSPIEQGHNLVLYIWQCSKRPEDMLSQHQGCQHPDRIRKSSLAVAL